MIGSGIHLGQEYHRNGHMNISVYHVQRRLMLICSIAVDIKFNPGVQFLHSEVTILPFALKW